MSKSNKRTEDDDFDEAHFNELKRAYVNKRRARRFDRALKTKNINDLLKYKEDEDSYEDDDGIEFGPKNA